MGEGLFFAYCKRCHSGFLFTRDGVRENMTPVQMISQERMSVQQLASCMKCSGNLILQRDADGIMVGCASKLSKGMNFGDRSCSNCELLLKSDCSMQRLIDLHGVGLISEIPFSKKWS